jgi:hypothetical protein
VSTRSTDQTAISVSVSRELLALIDKRAEFLNIPRSKYLAVIAKRELDNPQETIIATDPPTKGKIIDWNDEALRFLLQAIPLLANFDRERHDLPPLIPVTDPPDPVSDAEAAIWNHFLDEREEILKHKWIESKKAGKDIGLERAIRDWLEKYYLGWIAARKPRPRT